MEHSNSPCSIARAASIPDSEFRAAEKLAKRLGISRSELYQAALSNYLARHAETGITEKLNQVYAAEINPF